jgi:hypothetical protein
MPQASMTDAVRMDEHPTMPESPLPPMPGDAQWSALPPSAVPAVQAPAPAPPRRRWWPVALALVVAIVAGVVTYAALAGGSSLPDSLGGADRVTEGPMAEAMNAFDDMEIMGVTFDVAIYGGDLLPNYMVMVINGDVPGSDPESLLSTLPAGVVAQNGASVDFSKAISEQVGDTEYVCVPAANEQATSGFGQDMSMCVFQGPDNSGIVMSFLGEDLTGLMDVTQELYAEL